MTLTQIMQGCFRARRLCATDSERQGVDRAAAAILDGFGVPSVGTDRARFLRIAQGI